MDSPHLLSLADGKPIAICSANPRPATHSGRKGGNQWWARDVYHLASVTGRTLCGRMTPGWMTIGPVKEVDHNCCERCAATLRALSQSHSQTERGEA